VLKTSRACTLPCDTNILPAVQLFVLTSCLVPFASMGLGTHGQLALLLAIFGLIDALQPVNNQGPACSVEEDIKYGRDRTWTTFNQPPELDSDIVGRAWKGFNNMTECANFCFLHSQCKFWSYNIRKNTCWLRTSDQGRLGRKTREEWFVSGQKACGRAGVNAAFSCLVSFKDQLTDRQMLLRLER